MTSQVLRFAADVAATLESHDVNPSDVYDLVTNYSRADFLAALAVLDVTAKAGADGMLSEALETIIG